MSATTWVALLRGINVGRNKRVPMAGLRALLEGLGCADVRTHLQSGNALFTVEDGEAGDLEARIADALEAEFGFEVTVLVRAADEFAAVAEANPFVADRVDPKELHVAFLSADPAATAIDALEPTDYEPDEYRFGDRAIYLRLVNGIMGSRLPDWERTLGVAVTQRNWNTVSRLRELAAG